jgi:hypothetical protein
MNSRRLMGLTPAKDRDLIITPRIAARSGQLCPLRVIRVGAISTSPAVHVRFRPKADRQQFVSASPLCANCGRMHCSKTASLLDRLVDPAGIDVDNSTPNHLNIYVSERDYDINPRFSALIGFVVHGYPHNDSRILRARLRPFALNNFRLFELSKQALHEHPSLQVATQPPRRQGAKRTRAVSFDHQTNRAMPEPITIRETSVQRA